ncbi:hypothetical protein FO519_002287 [Halicephalobus sp. NKZ332]|nr:hypothetical protein FO519_002287 [Halicephalobus sp. NKZ332]
MDGSSYGQVPMDPQVRPDEVNPKLFGSHMPLEEGSQRIQKATYSPDQSSSVSDEDSDDTETTDGAPNEVVADPLSVTARAEDLLPHIDGKGFPSFDPHQIHGNHFIPFPGIHPNFYQQQPVTVDNHNSTSTSDCGTSSDFSDNSGSTTESSNVNEINPNPLHAHPGMQNFNQFVNMQQNSEMLQRIYSCYPGNFGGQQNVFQGQSWPPPVPVVPGLPQMPQFRPQRPSAVAPVAEEVSDEDLARRITVSLGNENIWKRFEKVQTEMIITKNGRNLFPKLTFKVQGLEPQNCYLMFLFFRRVSENKYKYSRGEWVSAGKADELEGTPPVPHGDNVNFPKGQEWMHNEVSFAKLKLTNSLIDWFIYLICFKVVLRSMHKYRPVLRILRFNPVSNQFSQLMDKDIESAEFIAVTAYQNSEVTSVKIEQNPFAKGFREGGRKRTGSALDPLPAKQPNVPFMMSNLLNNSQNMLPLTNYFQSLPPPLNLPGYYGYNPMPQNPMFQSQFMYPFPN